MSKRKKVIPSNLTEEEIGVALFEFLTRVKRYKLVIPNVAHGFLETNYEADIIGVTANRFVHEIEIKISISDLKAEAKKKHLHDDSRISKFYYAFPGTMDLAKAIPAIIMPNGYGIFVITKTERGDIYCREYIEAIARDNIRKLNETEMYKLARLGSMRAWSYRKKYIREFIGRSRIHLLSEDISRKTKLVNKKRKRRKKSKTA